MRRLVGPAMMGLVLASPAAALDRPEEGGEARSPRTAAPARPVAALVPRNVELDSRGLVATPDPNAPRLFGSLPVSDNLNVGVGLFSVVGTTEKEQVRRRMDPTRDFRRADTRVAAVGLSLKF